MSPEELKLFMLRHELRQKECAAALGVSTRHLRRMLCGDREITKTIALLVAALDQISTIPQTGSVHYEGSPK